MRHASNCSNWPVSALRERSNCGRVDRLRRSTRVDSDVDSDTQRKPQSRLAAPRWWAHEHWMHARSLRLVDRAGQAPRFACVSSARLVRFSGARPRGHWPWAGRPSGKASGGLMRANLIDTSNRPIDLRRAGISGPARSRLSSSASRPCFARLSRPLPAPHSLSIACLHSPSCLRSLPGSRRLRSPPRSARPRP